MTSPYKNIIFDLDGTISDSRLGIYNALKYSLHEMKVEIADDYDLSGFIGPPIYDCYKEHFFSLDNDINTAIKHFRKYYAETGWAENEMYEGMYDLLSYLYIEGYKLFVATNKPQVFTDLIMKNFGITDFFKLVKGVDIDNHHHTKAELIKEILESDEGIDAKNTVMIGDSKWDIFAADYHQIKTIGVSWGFGGTKKELESYGTLKVADTVDELRTFLLS
ncbi:MAG: HAD hydrolase-like protein [Bacteroidia bacterium]